jgi:hypothetical protein
LPVSKLVPVRVMGTFAPCCPVVTERLVKVGRRGRGGWTGRAAR